MLFYFVFHATLHDLVQGVQGRMVLVVLFFVFLKLFFCFVVAIFDLVHAVEAIFHLPELLTSFGFFF